jgi:hypothetical protein
LQLNHTQLKKPKFIQIVPNWLHTKPQLLLAINKLTTDIRSWPKYNNEKIELLYVFFRFSWTTIISHVLLPPFVVCTPEREILNSLKPYTFNI